jgi:hypothetical protein
MREEDAPPIRLRRDIPHYHGDAVRALFFLAALILIIAQSTGAELPLSTGLTVMTAAVLVVAAGITNPAQRWIHWVNAALAVLGVVVFGTTVVERYRTGTGTSGPTFIFLEALALLSLIALYFVVRTIRGLVMKPGEQ